MGRQGKTRDVQLLMAGLDGSGKTSILYQLKLGEAIETVPTVGCNVEVMEYMNLRLTVWDLRGNDRLLTLWQTSTDEKGARALVFVVDSADHQRMSEARQQLQELLADNTWRETALLVYANKQDLPGALSSQEVSDVLSLRSLTCPWHVQETSAAGTAEGIYEGLQWLLPKLRTTPARTSPAPAAGLQSQCGCGGPFAAVSVPGPPLAAPRHISAL